MTHAARGNVTRRKESSYLCEYLERTVNRARGNSILSTPRSHAAFNDQFSSDSKIQCLIPLNAYPTLLQGEDETMANTLQGKRIAILVDNGFEQAELLEPRKALDDAGANTEVVSPQKSKVKGWNHTDWGTEVPVDVSLNSAKAEDFHALLLPGGVMNPDHLRMNPAAVQFVKHFVDAGKPIAAICHGPWTLIEAGAVRGKTMTSWPSLKSDLKNAGAEWVDQEVVHDDGLVTSRKPDDIPAFNREMVRLFSQTRHTPARAAESEKTSTRKTA
jgi:protease I